MSRPGKWLARFVMLPENRAALLAVQDLIAAFASQRLDRAVQLLFLHGPPGTGKTHLASALLEEAANGGKREGALLSARDLFGHEPEANTESVSPLDSHLNHKLLIIEDVQHLPSRAMGALGQLLDDRRAHGVPTVLTATAGPRHLGSSKEPWPNRLVSRLAAGLVVGLEPLQAPSRRRLLEELAQRRQLAVSAEVLAWLAEHVSGGGRQMEGLVHQLAELNRWQHQPLDVATVAAHCQELIEASRPTVERIAQEVSSYFHVEPRHLQSPRRQRNILLPRQIGMYLARQLTSLSLDEIGAYFGGRDHSTVLHACRKVAQVMESNANLCGAVRQIHADLL